MPKLFVTNRELIEQWVAACRARDSEARAAVEADMAEVVDLAGLGLEELEMLAAIEHARDRVDLREGELVAAIDDAKGPWLFALHDELREELAAVEVCPDIIESWRETADIVGCLGEEYYLQVLTVETADAIVRLCRAGEGEAVDVFISALER